MTERNKDIRPRMKFEVMDCTDLKYQNEQFDLIIDKSTIDALVCGDFASMNVAKMMKECQRTLKTGGTYVAISYGSPENRVFYYLKAHLKFSMQTFTIYKKHKETGHPCQHYIYMLKKEPGAEQVCLEKWPTVYEEIKSEMEKAGEIYLDDENGNEIDDKQIV